MNKAEFFELANSQPKTKVTKFFGKAITIRKLTRSELTAYQAWQRPDGKLDTDRFEQRDAKIIQLAVVDENGQQIFDESDLDKFDELPGADIAELVYEVMVFNGLMAPIPDDLLGKSDS